MPSDGAPLAAGMIGKAGAERAAGAIIVLALHAAALWGLWNHQLLPTPQEVTTLFVNFIAPPAPPKVEAAPRPAKREPPRPLPAEPPQQPQPRQLAAAAPITSTVEAVVPPPLPAPVITAPVEARPAGPIKLGGELSLSCPERTPPNYPLLSRRMGETGIAVLVVELDEQGRVAAARVATGSGFARLDEAALAAVRAWRCNPPQRDGAPVRAVALQPFKFALQGN